MIEVSTIDVLALVGGCSDGLADRPVTGLTTDSRSVSEGDLFVALKGQRVDAAGFIDQALGSGASAALTTQRGVGRITVADPLGALRAVAADQRDRCSATVIAITGSAGKTLTKDLLAAALESGCRVVPTRGNQNNELGVPLTLCAVREDTDALVVEVGARGMGHIASLMPMVRPDISIVLNVGRAHAGEFGGIEATATAKRELVEGLGPDGLAILNADDPRTLAMASSAPRAITFGQRQDSTIRLCGLDHDSQGRAHMQLATPERTLEVRLPIPGLHLASNAMAAIAVVWELGLDLDAAASAIQTASTSPGRMRAREAGKRLILDDAYNASPDSMAAGLKTLAMFVPTRSTWAVIGQMAELGDDTFDEHDRIGRLATRLGIDHLIVVGETATPALLAARHEGMSTEDAQEAADIDAALELLRHAPEDAVILVKASRAAGLDRIANALVEEAAL